MKTRLTSPLVAVSQCRLIAVYVFLSTFISSEVSYGTPSFTGVVRIFGV